MAFLRYTLLRALLLAVFVGIGWLAGLRGIVLMVVALIASGLASIVVLSRSRDAASTSLADRLAAIRSRMQASASAEDEWDDQQRSRQADEDRPR